MSALVETSVFLNQIFILVCSIECIYFTLYTMQIAIRLLHSWIWLMDVVQRLHRIHTDFLHLAKLFSQYAPDRTLLFGPPMVINRLAHQLQAMWLTHSNHWKLNGMVLLLNRGIRFHQLLFRRNCSSIHWKALCVCRTKNEQFYQSFVNSLNHFYLF